MRSSYSPRASVPLRLRFSSPLHPSDPVARCHGNLSRLLRREISSAYLYRGSEDRGRINRSIITLRKPFGIFRSPRICKRTHDSRRARDRVLDACIRSTNLHIPGRIEEERGRGELRRGGGCSEIQRGGGRFVLKSCNKCHLSVARPRWQETRCCRFRHASRRDGARRNSRRTLLFGFRDLVMWQGRRVGWDVV